MIAIFAAAAGVLVQHPAENHVGVWHTPPYRCPTSMVSDCPLLGNGDMGVGLGGIEGGGSVINASFYIGKMDFWTQQNMASTSQEYFAHVAPGHLTMSFGATSTTSKPRTAVNMNLDSPACIPKDQYGQCVRPTTIPCTGNGVGCVLKDDSYNGTAAGLAAVRAQCAATPKCLAYGLYENKRYQFYNVLAQILDPYQDAGWTLFYKNETCCFGPGKPEPAPSPSPHPPSAVRFEATQELFAARVNATLGSNLSPCGNITSSSVVAPDDNVLVSRLSVLSPCHLTLTLQTPNMYGLPIAVGATPTKNVGGGGVDGSSSSSSSSHTLWMSRQNNKWVHNDAVVVECTPNVVLSATLRYFKMPTAASVSTSTSTSKLVPGAIGPLLNSTASAEDAPMCMWLGDDSAELQPHQSRADGFVSMAKCGTTGTDWHYDPATGLISSLSNPSVCVGYAVGAPPAPQPAGNPSGRQIVAPVDCSNHNKTMWATSFNVSNLNPATGFGMFMARAAGPAHVLDPRALDPTPPCLGIVRDNINISVGMAVSLTDSDGAGVPTTTAPSIENGDLSGPDCQFPGHGRPCAAVSSSTVTYELSTGTVYTLQVAITSTRGGDVAQEASATAAAVNAATKTDPAIVEKDNAVSWSRWWDASTVSLGAKRQLLESFWYGAQYMLNCFTKNQTGGGVIPGLLGPWSLQDPVGWSDDVTLDYNAEANFYGAASSNHQESMWPYFPTISALIPLGQQRASLPSWSQGGHESGAFYGQMTEAMGCNCNDYMHCYEEANGQHCPAGFGGFDGIEIPSAIGGFVDMHCSHDSSMRSTAAMAAQPYVDYYEHTQDLAFLKQWAYPFVKEVALFYASYAALDAATGKYGFPLACAQEVCSGRQQGGYHPQESPTIDLAYAKYVFGKAGAWGKLLGENSTVLARWAHVAANLQLYPTTTLPVSQFEWCASSNCSGWSEATNTDTNTPAVMPANYMWPIANFAPVHPTGEVTLDADTATKTLARNTIHMVNSFSGWHPVNGICLAWPSAARMMDKHDPYPVTPGQLLDTWASALDATMQRNFWPSMGGGGLEQVGATQAINELLLQSYQGVLRFFPGWPLNETANFTTLRAVGAFLVSAEVDASGHVSAITIVSEAGVPCRLLSPWEPVGVGVAVQASGKPVAVKQLGSGRYQFETVAGATYSVGPAVAVD